MAKIEKRTHPLEMAFLNHPDDSSAAMAYHKYAVTSGALDRARSYFKDAVLRYPKNKRLHHLYISLLLQLTAFQEALKSVEDIFLRFGIDDEMIAPALSIREKVGPFDKLSKTKSPQPRISLCMIVKDEMHLLMASLTSVKPLVHEMIVVDTGSKDQTAAMAKIFGAKLYEYPFNGNFSDARNFAAGKASGDWILSLDADEVISFKDVSKFENLIRDRPGPLSAFSFTTRNYTKRCNLVDWQANDNSYSEERGLGWYPSKKVRLFPNKPEYQFEFPIHEKVEPSLKRHHAVIHPADVVIHHYGPLDEEKLAKKGRAYLDMGRIKVDSLGDDMPALRELAVQAGNLERWEEAAEIWEKLIGMKHDIPEFYLNLGTSLWHMGAYDLAFENAQKVCLLDPECVEGYFNSGMATLFMGKAKDSIDFFRQTLKKKENYLPAHLMMGVALSCLGEMDLAEKVMDSLNRPSLEKVLPISLKDVLERMKTGNLDHYQKCVQDLAQRCHIEIPEEIKPLEHD